MAFIFIESMKDACLGLLNLTRISTSEVLKMEWVSPNFVCIGIGTG